jgi:hypothetical protein
MKQKFPILIGTIFVIFGFATECQLKAQFF